MQVAPQRRLSQSISASASRHDQAEAAAPRAAARTAAAAAAAALLVSCLSPALPAAAGAGADFELPYAQPDITKDSTPRALQLAARLRDAGAHLYGAFWCSHCYEQEQAFGRQAMADFPYVECFPDGWRRGVELAPACAAVPVRAFPTWVIGGQIIEGELDFDAIAAVLDAEEGAATAATS